MVASISAARVRAFSAFLVSSWCTASVRAWLVRNSAIWISVLVSSSTVRKFVMRVVVSVMTWAP